MELFDNVWKLVGVPVITVQLRYDGWVTEMAADNGLQPSSARQPAGPLPRSRQVLLLMLVGLVRTLPDSPVAVLRSILSTLVREAGCCYRGRHALHA